MAGCGCTVPGSPARLVHRLAQGLAGLERGRPRGGDSDGVVRRKGVADGGEHGRDHVLDDRPVMANEVVDTLSRIYNAAEDKGLIAEASNPCRVVAKGGSAGAGGS